MMKEPNWAICNEEEMWRYVAWHLEGEGIYSVLVGGAVVAIYTEGIYKSGDLDIIPDDFERKRLPQVLKKIGFSPSKSRYFKHEKCKHLVLEFPMGPVGIGGEYPIQPAEIEWEGRKLRLLSATDCVKDRLAAYIHWGVRDCFDQALLVCLRQEMCVDLENVNKWCVAEGGVAAFDELLNAVKNEKNSNHGAKWNDEG